MKKERELILLFVIILILLFFIPIINSTIFLDQPDAATGKDAYIRENSTVTYGSTNPTKLSVGKDTIPRELRSLIQFNVSNISSGNTIISAKLQLYVNLTTGYANKTIIIYRITSPWNDSSVNWYNANSSDIWIANGSDYAEELNFLIFQNATYSDGRYYNFTITEAVRGWVNGTYENYGLILISNNSQGGNVTDFASSNVSEPSQRPMIIIDYTGNAFPTINSISTNSNLTNPRQIGQQINFTINWTDLEGDLTQAFICNSSNINYTGCQDTTFCSVPFQTSGLSSCNYTSQSSNNRTNPFYVAVCDSGSFNCSEINLSYFYVNHAPVALVVQPNGGETVNQSQGSYRIKFNVSDADLDYLTGKLYYGLIPNSTSNLINSSLNLTTYCTDIDSNRATPNNCSYIWNTTGIFGTYYLTALINDSFSISNDTSDSWFNIRSLTDTVAPNITAQWIDTDIYSGKLTAIYANVSEENINTVWVSINTTPQTNLTMTNISSLETYTVNWTAIAVGNYEFKVYANDTLGNLNNSIEWQSFAVRKPNATAQNEKYPATAMPYSVIKITGELNFSDAVNNIYSYLNVPDDFTFLSSYPQNYSIGNFSANQAKTATWFLSVPLTETTYTLNITHSDFYSNTWQGSNFNILVNSTSGSGGGGGGGSSNTTVYFLVTSPYSEVQLGENYFIKAFFTLNGFNYTNPNSINISIYDPSGNPIINSSAMISEQIGIYNYTYSVPASQTLGQWKTIVNATKNSQSYYSTQYWKLANDSSGGGTGGNTSVYFVTVAGSPEVSTGNNYNVESYFTLNGIYSTPDSIKISLYNPLGSLIQGPVDMILKQTGVYNHTYPVPAGQTAGIWKTFVNATKNSANYYANQFWNLVGVLFDVKDIVVINSSINNLNISVTTENKGTVGADLILSWNLSRTDTNMQLKAGGETFAVGANSSLVKYYSTTTNYTGEVKIIFLGRYSGTETAGAYKIFTTTLTGAPFCGDGTCNNGETCSSCAADCGVCPTPVTPSGGGGGGGAVAKVKKADFKIKNFEKTITLSKNLEKIYYLEVENTGETDLNDISLELENLNKSFYTITPQSASYLKKGNTQKFEIKFLVKDFRGEYGFNYLVKTKELSKKEPGNMIVLSIEDYILSEIERLNNRVKDVKNRTDDETLLNELKNCEDIIDTIKSDLKKEEFINANNNIKEADNCIDVVAGKIKVKKEAPMPTIKIEYVIWIATLALLIILILIMIIFIYIIFKKLKVLSFLKTTQTATGPKSLSGRREIKKQYFDDKIKKIQEKLKGR